MYDKDRKFKSESMLSAKLSAQIVLFVFSAVVFLSLATGGALFGVAGRAINKFILGVFGHSAYPLFLSSIYVTIKLFAKKRFTSRKKTVACAVVLFISAVLCYHLMTSDALLRGAQSYGEYLSGCFEAGSGGISSATGGGILFGLVVYPVRALFDTTGSYIVYCLVFAVTVAVLFGGRRNREIEGVKEYPLEIFGEQRQEPMAQAQQPQGYVLPEYSPRVIEPKPQPQQPAPKAEEPQDEGNVVKVPKKLFVGYIEDYVNPKAKRSKQHTRGFDILYSKPKDTDFGFRPEAEDAPPKPLGGASYIDTFGDDIESKKKYILTPITNILNPDEGYGRVYPVDAGKKPVEKPPRIDHNMGSAPQRRQWQASNQGYMGGNGDIYREEPPQDRLDNLSRLMNKYGEGRPAPEEGRGLGDIGQGLPPRPAESESGDLGFRINSAIPQNFQRKEDPLKYQTQINIDKENPVIKAPYLPPPATLLRDVSYDPGQVAENYEEKVRVLENTLNEFKVAAKVVSVTPGPTVTRFELQMPPGVPVSRLTSRQDDIAMCLASNGKVRIEAPIPGKSLVGIEIPNSKRHKVGVKELIESPDFMNNKSTVTFALGKEISGKNIIVDLMKIPHLLVAGSTGSGKSVCLNTLIVSILYKASPDDVRLILIDPKRVEFNVYNGLPHLLLKEVITDAEKALSAFNWAIGEMERRFEMFKETMARDIVGYNQKMRQSGGQTLPRILIIVDELADLMLISKRELEEKIKRISQLSRAAGIHLILATQRPSVDIITGVIKANLSSRVTFRLMSQADSRTVIDCAGAEKLLGEGDMIFISTMPRPMRLQGPYISMEEVEAVVEFIKTNNEAQFDDMIESEIMNYGEGEDLSPDDDSDEVDKYFVEALKLAVEQGQISISMVQRRFAVGYSRAGKIIDEMEKLHLISPFEGSKPRSVLISKEEFERRFGKGGQKDL